MNLDGLRVNHGGLEQAAADLYQAVKDIDDRMARLEGELEPLKSDWTGNAQQQYEVAKRKWNQAIDDMRNLLEDTSRTVNTSNEEYRSADKRGAAAFEIG